MAKRIPVSSITKEYEELIDKNLILLPKKTSFSPLIPDHIPLKCYDVIDGYVHIPFLFYYKLCSKFGVPVTNDAVSGKECAFNFTGKLRDYQEPLIKSAISQLTEHSTTSLWLPPGYGKTAMGMYLGSNFTTNKPMLIAICKTPLIRSWEGTVREFTDASMYIVPTGTIDLVKLRAAKVIIAMDTRLKKLPSDFRAGVVIIDEAHMWVSGTNRIMCVLRMVCDYVILESATPELKNGMNRLLTLIAGKHNVSSDYTVAVKLIKVNTRINPKLETENSIHELRTKIMLSDGYTDHIIHQVKQFPNEKVLVLTWMCKHVSMIMEKLTENNIPAIDYFGNKKGYIDQNVIVGTLQKVGVGFDEIFLASEYNGKRISVVILPMSIKDLSFFTQAIGRTFRSDSPTFVLFIDSHFICKSHWKQNLIWVNKHNVKIDEFNAY